MYGAYSPGAGPTVADVGTAAGAGFVELGFVYNKDISAQALNAFSGTRATSPTSPAPRRPAVISA